MYAIVDIGGQQFKVEKDQKLFVHRLEGEEGNKISFDKVLLIDNGSKVSVGDPVVKGAAVAVKILSHLKGDKVLVFKKKRRKGYQKLNGHRQYLTQIQIEGITEKSKATEPKAAATKETTSTKPAAAKTAVAETASAKKETPAKAPAAKKSTATKAAATKPTTTKKPAATKATATKPTTTKKPAAKKQTGEDKA